MEQARPGMMPLAGLLTFGRAFSAQKARRHVPWLDAKEFRAQSRPRLDGARRSQPSEDTPAFRTDVKQCAIASSGNSGQVGQAAATITKRGLARINYLHLSRKAPRTVDFKSGLHLRKLFDARGISRVNYHAG
jgi:hypothetical protein